MMANIALAVAASGKGRERELDLWVSEVPTQAGGSGCGESLGVDKESDRQVEGT